MEIFSHVGLNCRDILTTERFYSKHFGFRRARVVGEGTGMVLFLRMEDSPLHLELFHASGESPVPPPTKDGYPYAGYRHIAFKVDNLDKKLAEIGDEATVTLGPLSFDEFIPGWRTAWIADPDGRIVEISQGYVDQEVPPWVVPEERR